MILTPEGTKYRSIGWTADTPTDTISDWLNVERETVELMIHETPDFIPLSLWPPNSPGRNPVDYTVLGVLQQRVYREKILTAELHYGGVETPRASC